MGKKNKRCASEHNGHKCWGSLAHYFQHWAMVPVEGKLVKIVWD